MPVFEGQTRRFTESGTGGVLSVPVDIEVVVNPGAVNVERTQSDIEQRGLITVNVSATPGGENLFAPATITPTISGVSSVSSNLRDRVSSDLDTMGITRGNIPSAMLPSTPSISGFGSDTIDAGASRYVNSFQSNRFTPLVSPVDVDRLTAIPNATISVQISLGMFSFGTVDVEIPWEALVVEASLNDLECATLFTDINNNIQNIRSGLTPLGVAEADAQEIISLADNLRGQVPSNLSEADPSQLRDIDQSTIDRVESLLQDSNTQSWLSDARSINQTISETESDIDNIGLNRCQNEFSSTLSNLSDRAGRLESTFSETSNAADFLRELLSVLEQAPSRIPCSEQFSSLVDDIDRTRQETQSLESPITAEQLQSRLDSLSSIRSRINNNIQDGNRCKDDLLSRVDNIERTLRTLRDEDGLDCSDVPLSIRNLVGGFEADGQTFAQRGEQTRTRKQSLLSEGSDIISTVENRVSDRNPCKSSLLSRVRQTRSTVRQVSVGPPEPQACFEQFSRIDDRVDNFEERVLQLSGTSTPAEFNQLSTDAQSLVDDITSTIPEDSRCRNRYINRVNSALDRVSQEAQSVRVRTGFEQDDLGDVRTEVESLREQLETIEAEFR